MDRQIEVYANGERYSILAVEGDDGRFRPSVALVAPDGDVARTIVDAETTDEEYGDARDCLLRAMIHVL